MSQFITDNQQLALFCQQAEKQPVLAVDTEFIRQSTLIPKLGLIQLFDGQQLALVDPLCISQWQPLQQLFANTAITKVLHSCTEDIEALATVGLENISPLFDTQLAAEILGWGNSIGYARLVEQQIGQLLDKSESRTDWLARPLTDTQLQYAADDVRYLLPTYQAILQHFNEPWRLEVLLAEGQQLVRRRHNPTPVRFRYLEIKNSWLLKPRELAVLRELTAWRQRYAEQHDLALGLILKDFQLLELAKRRPATAESLMNIPGLPPRESRRHAKVLTELILQAKELLSEQCPQTFYHPELFSGFKAFSAGLNEAVAAAAGASAIPASFLSVKRQQLEYLNWCWRVSDEERSQLALPEYLSDWRTQYLAPYLPVPAHVKDLI